MEWATPASPLGRYNYIGHTNLKVSALCLGTMTFGDHTTVYGPGESDESEAFAIMDRFEAAGGNFLDTANVYTNGKSETIVGKWLAKRDRSKFVLATKVRFAADPEGRPDTLGLSRHAILRNIDDSLRRLQTSYVDIYYMHCEDVHTPLEETILTMRDLLQQGKIHYLGVSNFTGWRLQKIVQLCEKYLMPGVLVYQSQYSLLARDCEWDIVPCCHENHISVIPWSPLKGGLLTGKYTRDMKEAPEGTRIHWADKTGKITQGRPSWSQFQDNELYWGLIEEMRAIAAETGKSLSQIALRWLLQQPDVPSLIFGARNLTQLEDNLQAVGWRLSEDQMKRLTQHSDKTLPYPHIMIAMFNK